MSTKPAFTSTVRNAVGAVSAANTNRDGTGTIVSILTGVAAGTRVFEIDVKAIATTTAGMVRLFLSFDNGSTWKLYDEVLVSAVTPSASVAAFKGSITPPNLLLPNASTILGASTHNAETFNVFVIGGDLT